MRVIMSMNVLMPSWSYSLLMSNVLFKPSLAARPRAAAALVAAGLRRGSASVPREASHRGALVCSHDDDPCRLPGPVWCSVGGGGLRLLLPTYYQERPRPRPAAAPPHAECAARMAHAMKQR